MKNDYYDSHFVVCPDFNTDLQLSGYFLTVESASELKKFVLYSGHSIFNLFENPKGLVNFFGSDCTGKEISLLNCLIVEHTWNRLEICTFYVEYVVRKLSIRSLTELNFERFTIEFNNITWIKRSNRFFKRDQERNPGTVTEVGFKLDAPLVLADLDDFSVEFFINITSNHDPFVSRFSISECHCITIISKTVQSIKFFEIMAARLLELMYLFSGEQSSVNGYRGAIKRGEHELPSPFEIALRPRHYLYPKGKPRRLPLTVFDLDQSSSAKVINSWLTCRDKINSSFSPYYYTTCISEIQVEFEVVLIFQAVENWEKCVSTMSPIINPVSEEIIKLLSQKKFKSWTINKYIFPLKTLPVIVQNKFNIFDLVVDSILYRNMLSHDATELHGISGWLKKILEIIEAWTIIMHCNYLLLIDLPGTYKEKIQKNLFDPNIFKRLEKNRYIVDETHGLNSHKN